MYSGDCVYLNSCPPLKELYEIRSGNLTDRMFLSRSQCGLHDGQPLVCCRETFVASVTVVPPRQSPFVVTTTVTPKVKAQLESLLPKPGKCGFSADDYIYGGNVTLIDEYPWMVLLQYTKRKKASLFHHKFF